MDLLLSRVEATESGAAREQQQRIPGTVFQVGRGTQCEIHLPDARVALVHARISLGAGSAVIEAVEQQFVHNDREVSGAQLGVGDLIEIGPYVLKVEEPPADVALALSVQLSKRVATKAGSGLFRALMLAPRLSKRRLSYAAFFGTLLVALVAPIGADLVANRELPLPDQARERGRELVHAMTVGLVQAWNPGELSRGHASFAHECRACHKVPFERVRDKACASCHTTLREHLPRARLSGPAAFVLAETRCADCHVDHKGRDMAPRSQEICAQCHGDVQRAGLKVTSRSVSDFATDHPHFRLSLVDGVRPKEIRRVRQREPGQPLEEHSGLKFNHTLHLDPQGVREPRGPAANAMRTALGGRKVLECKSCHEPDAEGIGMRPISMEKHCASCHALAFEPQATSREVPHGPLPEVERALREFYARLVLGDVPEGVKVPRDLPRMRPGVVPTPEERRAALKLADEKAQRALQELVQTRQVCTTCHQVTREKQSWKVAPVALTMSWMPASRFRHDKHASQSCTSCHEVRTSRRAEDVAMPEIGRCRDCHGAHPASANNAASDCATCHRFHGGQGLWH
jgi:hypothetical protein